MAVPAQSSDAMTTSRLQRGRHTLARIVGWTRRLAFVTTIALPVLIGLNTLAHIYLHTCPLHFARFDGRAIVRVVYGLPLGGELFERAARGEIVLGGCVVGPVTGVCPYCHWPAAIVDNGQRNDSH